MKPRGGRSKFAKKWGQAPAKHSRLQCSGCDGRSQPPFFHKLAVVAFVGLLAIPGLGLAQENAPRPSASLGFGTHLFRNVLNDLKQKPVSDRQELLNDPANSVLIVLGQTDFLNDFDLVGYLKAGGSALIATDREARPRCLTELGIRVVGRLVQVEEGSPASYKNATDCIFVQATDRKHPLFQGLRGKNADLTGLATNRPGYLLRLKPTLPVLAVFPEGCRPENVTFPPGERFVFAAGGQVGNGRLLLLSDHSVFINAMLWQGDNKNLDFAYNCVEWLTEDKEKKVLFYEEGIIQPSFQVPLTQLPPPPLPPMERLVRAFDETLAGMEEENWFNKVTEDLLRRVDQARVVQLLLAFATMGMGLYGLSRLSQARHRLEPELPLVAGGLAQLVRSTSLLDLRHRAMVRSDNYWEAARVFARQGWEDILGPQLPTLTAGANPRLPPLPFPGNGWQRWRLRQQAKRLWRLAYASEPVPVSARRLTQLPAAMKTVHDALTQSPTG
jgi:hypothetical protein